MKTLSFTQNKKTYTSKPFDFEAFCLINEKHLDSDIKGKYVCCKEAIEYLFGEDKLKNIGVQEMVRLCNDLWQIYSDVLVETTKNE